MFRDIQQLPADPILGLSALYKADDNPQKVDLGVGVYKDDRGTTPIMGAVKSAYNHLANTEDSKAYIAPKGWPGYTEAITKLALGDELVSAISADIGVVQTPGGCGALRLGFELIASIKPGTTVWVSDPTWPIHGPMIEACGLVLKPYRYFEPSQPSAFVDGMLDDLEAAAAGDVVLLHGCCHNPTGADIPENAIEPLLTLIEEKDLIPFVDMAYQGFAKDLGSDAELTRKIFQRLPNAFLSYSCSKNFGLYRERTGAIFAKGQGGKGMALETHLCKIARQCYSMPPAHGAAIVATILGSEELTRQWQTELSQMLDRIKGLRVSFAKSAAQSGLPDTFAGVDQQAGMFSLLNLSKEQVQRLQKTHSIYMPANGRVNIVGLTEKTIPYVVQSLHEVL